MKLLLVILLITISMFGQAATHSATLNWVDASNPTGTTYNIYRATGLCSGTPAFTKVVSALAVKTYQDTTVTPGNYCYQVTATFNGIESSPSNQAGAPIPSFAPTNLSLTIQ